jgi:hypothetical protein
MQLQVHLEDRQVETETQGLHLASDRLLQQEAVAVDKARQVVTVALAVEVVVQTLLVQEIHLLCHLRKEITVA